MNLVTNSKILRLINNTTLVEVEQKAEMSVIGLDWRATDDSLQVCRGNSRNFDHYLRQSSIESESLSPLAWRQLLNGIWRKKLHQPSQTYWGIKNFLIGQNTYQIHLKPAGRTYFNRAQKKWNFMFSGCLLGQNVYSGISTLTCKRTFSGHSAVY